MQLFDLANASFQVSRELDRASTIDSIQRLFAEAIASVGLTCSACGMATGALAAKPVPFYFTNWPSDWREHYETSGFVAIDPLPRHAIKSGRPLTWSEVRRALPPNDPGHKVYVAAARWGFTEGMAISFRSDLGDVGLVTMGGNRKPFDPDEIDYLHVVSAAAFRSCLRVSHDQSVYPPALFTRREEECIRLLKTGIPDAEIGRALGVRTTTVVTHLENARRKINARSRTHLVALTTQMASTQKVSP